MYTSIEVTMKKYMCIFILVLTVFSAFANGNDTKYVSVEKVFLKSGTGFFSKKVAELSYGQQVLVLQEDGSKSYVSVHENDSIAGWISNSSLTTKKIVVRDNKTVSTSADELALAGKGFNQEVEDFYKNDKEIDFSVVDAIESISIKEEELKKFIVDGKLHGVEE